MEDTEFAAAVEAQMQWREEARKLITFRAALHPTHQTARFPGFSQRINHYTAGTQIQKGALPLPVDLVMHESVPTTLSDGTTIYSDIFFPGGFDSLENSECAERVPAIVAWSPYGKQAGTTILDDFPMRAGVPLHWLSGLQKWEGPDPAFWCQHGYAVVNVDTRGAYTSEGDLLIMGYQEAQDGAEFITWLSKQPWCNGKVGLTGNSWLALAQWKIGSLRPEGLAALAPWEGLEDCYRDDLCMGGIPFPAFNKSIADTFASRGKLEDMAAALEKSPLWNSYWEDKKGHSEWINVPTYVVASWTNPIHTPGTLRAYSKIPESVPKWLRVHNSMEWPDYYEDHSQRDLKRFFDYTLKGDHDNGWASTPKVRLSVLHFGLSDLGDTVNRPETDWPLQRTKYRTLYLGSDGRLSQRMEGSEGSVCYDSGNGRAEFRWTLPEEVETTGHFLVRLVMSCPSHNDMDIFVQVHCIKAGADQASGVLTIKPKSPVILMLLKFMHDWQIGMQKTGMIFHWGPDGQLRASHSMDKHGSSLHHLPIYEHKRTVPLEQDERRVLEIPLRPYGMFWKRGDKLQLVVAGNPIRPFPVPGVEPLRGSNKGLHVIHCADRGEESSCIILPCV